jgi:hypothetical protein
VAGRLVSVVPAAAEWLRAFGADVDDAAGVEDALAAGADAVVVRTRVEAARVEAAGRRALVFAPRRYRDVLDGALTLARAADRLPEAFRALGDGEARLMALVRRLGISRRYGTVGGAPAPSVLLLDGLDPLRAAGGWVPDLVTHAGGRPALAARSRSPRALVPADLPTAEPDVLVVALPGRSPEDALATWGAHGGSWPPLGALEEGRAWAVSGPLLHRPGPGLVRAVEVLAAVVHGERAGVEVPSGEAVRLG